MKGPEHIIKISFVALIMGLLVSCTRSDSAAVALGPNEFEQKLSAMPGSILIDVRTPEEHGAGHLPDAVLINIHERDFSNRLEKLDKSKPIFLYCASGIRSEKAATILDELGFKKVFTLEGGTRDWVEAGKPLVTE